MDLVLKENLVGCLNWSGRAAFPDMLQPFVRPCGEREERKCTEVD